MLTQTCPVLGAESLPSPPFLLAPLQHRENRVFFLAQQEGTALEKPCPLLPSSPSLQKQAYFRRGGHISMSVGPSACRQSPYPDRGLRSAPALGLMNETFDFPSCEMQASTAARQFWRRDPPGSVLGTMGKRKISLSSIFPSIKWEDPLVREDVSIK